MKLLLIFLVLILIIGGATTYYILSQRDNSEIQNTQKPLDSFNLEDGKYVIEEDIGKIKFEKVGQTMDCLSSKIDSRCNTIQGIYRVSDNEKYNVWVEFPVKFDERYGTQIDAKISKEMFASAVQERYAGSEEKTNSGNTYYYYKDGSSVRVMWVNEGVEIIRITTNDYSSNNEENLATLLDIYLKIYPSSL